MASPDQKNGPSAWVKSKDRFWRQETFWIGVYLIAITIVSTYILVDRWPDEHLLASTLTISATVADTTLILTSQVDSDTLMAADTLRFDRVRLLPDTAAQGAAPTLDTTRVSQIPPHALPTSPQTLFWLILAVGALGACLHALTSLAEYVGNKSFEKSWVLWYFLRPFVGATLAILFYFVLRAGLISIDTNENTLYGVVALAGLIGLFSKQALYKLGDIFDVLFQSNKEENLKDKLNIPAPIIDAFDPPSVAPGSKDVKLTVKGRNFVDASKVQINGEDRVTTFGSATELTVTLLDTDVAQKDTLKVTIVNPDDKGGASQPKDFPVEQPAATTTTTTT